MVLFEENGCCRFPTNRVLPRGGAGGACFPEVGTFTLGHQCVTGRVSGRRVEPATCRRLVVIYSLED